MADYIIFFFYMIVWGLVAGVGCFIGYRQGYGRGFDVGQMLNYDNMEKSGRVLFIVKEGLGDIDKIIISNDEKIITYKKEREI